MKSKLLTVRLSSIASGHVIRALSLIVALGLAGRAQAAFHLWSIREIYSNSSGSLQFIEMFTASAGQELVGGQTITVTDAANPALQHMFTIPSNLVVPGGMTTANHAFLLATSGAQAAGAPAPDYATLPTGFLFPDGGTISFFGANSGQSYPALPTDGIHSLTYPSGPTAINSLQNFAGTVGQVVPEPAAITLAAIGGICASCFLRRRRG